MARTNYEIRAEKFARQLSKMFEGCVYRIDFLRKISEYNRTHVRKLRYDYGVSRIAIIRSDYVIKFDYQAVDRWADGRAGNCMKEEEVYKKAVRDGMEYLLAKTKVLHLNGLTCSIMPKINHVNDDRRNWRDYCTCDEFRWLVSNLCDLHWGNVGYRNRKVCVIDYAFVMQLLGGSCPLKFVARWAVGLCPIFHYITPRHLLSSVFCKKVAQKFFPIFVQDHVLFFCGESLIIILVRGTES